MSRSEDLDELVKQAQEMGMYEKDFNPYHRPEIKQQDLTDNAMKQNIFGDDPQKRKDCPVFTGCLMYFPKALAAVARLSLKGNQQHHPDKPLHWDRSKSADELDALTRHLIEGEWDAVAWRALANLEKQIEKGWKPE